MSTQSCKDFLAEHAQLLGEPEGQVWKRVSKRSQEGSQVREFQSPTGRVISLSELDGEIRLASASFELPTARCSIQTAHDLAFGILHVGPDPVKQLVVDFLVDCLQADPAAIHANALADALAPISWEAHFIILDGGQDGNFPPHEAIELPYEGQPESLTFAQVDRVYELHMPHYDTAYRFAIYLGRDGCLYLGENNPD